MGAVLALLVVVVDDVQRGIHIVEAEGQLLVEIQLLSGQTGHPLGGVELGQNCLNGSLVHQLQGVLVGCQGHALGLCVLGQGIEVGAIVQGLVIGVRTGVHNGDAGTGTGVAAVPEGAGADHAAAGIGSGDDTLVTLCHGGLILCLHGHGLDTVNGGDLLQGAVGHPGGDQVAHQGHVPDHIQGPSVQCTDRDGLLHPLLGSQQLGPVAPGLGVGGDAHGGKASLHGGGLFQHDGHTDHLAVITFCFAVLFHRAVRQFCGDFQISFFPGQLCCTGCRNKRQHHAYHEQPGKDPLEGMLHILSLLVCISLAG